MHLYCFHENDGKAFSISNKSENTSRNPITTRPVRKRRRIQFSYYLDDHNAHSKETIRSPPKKFPVKPYKYSMGEEEEY